MRLIDDISDQKLSLDLTPLIDIVFLLVMFFAVSTSFISSADLNLLKSNLYSENEANEQLRNKIGKLENDYKLLLTQAENDSSNISQLNKEISNATEIRMNLERALSMLKTEAEQQANKEILLNSLLLEEKNKNRNLNEKLPELASESTALQEKLSAAQLLLKDKEGELKKTRVLTESIEAREVSLQELLEERTEALNIMIARFESADAEKESVIERQNEMKATVNQLIEEAKQSKTELIAVKTELSKFENIADADKDQIENAILAQKQLSEGMRRYIDSDGLRITRDHNKITLQLSDQILFASGSTNIKRGGLEVLKEIGSILKIKTMGLEVQVGGHTDNVPVSANDGPLADNWGISAARAVNVVRYFEKELDIESDHMSAVGYGEFRPVSQNDTPAGRAKNRRIEIVLVPR